ncbi:bacteriohemerythrin [Thalassotalea sp. M1531]|uniref:Bacteriohemerythrin n=1 Tax=Thalassotalea algicola TaxID=2716224 RepID=A0A7Y0Q731_9GAMM|nr:bacteriohemerythrin [Thalassotalea algicola]NMP30620.1 bacteriohemerythrin [Thalassotalea algicola]
MTKQYRALIYAAIIGLLTVIIFLGFLMGLDNKLSWLLVIVLVAIPYLYSYNKSNKVVRWKDSYSVGIESLDADHRKLLSLLNQFNTAYEYYMGESFERQSLKELIDYTHYHFEREEKMMEEAGYEDIEAHKKQHQAMIAEINVLDAKYAEHGHEAFAEISKYLTNWLLNHINGTDKQYSEVMIAKGLK